MHSGVKLRIFVSALKSTSCASRAEVCLSRLSRCTLPGKIGWLRAQTVTRVAVYDDPYTCLNVTVGRVPKTSENASRAVSRDPENRWPRTCDNSRLWRWNWLSFLGRTTTWEQQQQLSPFRLRHVQSHSAARSLGDGTNVEKGRSLRVLFRVSVKLCWRVFDLISGKYCSMLEENFTEFAARE
jgi:hypothetical protein